MTQRILTTQEKYQLVGATTAVAMALCGFAIILAFAAYIAAVYFEFKAAKEVKQTDYLPMHQSVGTLKLIQCGIGAGAALAFSAMTGSTLLLFILALYVFLAKNIAEKHDIKLAIGK